MDPVGTAERATAWASGRRPSPGYSFPVREYAAKLGNGGMGVSLRAAEDIPGSTRNAANRPAGDRGETDWFRQ